MTEAISWATGTHHSQAGPLGGKAWSCAEWAWTSFLAVSQKQAKVPGPPLQVYEYQLVPWPLPPPAPFSSLGGWRRHATHETKWDQGALTSMVLDKIPKTLTRENRWSFCCPPDCVSGSFVKGCPHRGPGISSLTGSMEVIAPGGEGKDSQDSLLEERTAHESTEKGWKECGEENWSIHRDPQDPGTPELSAIMAVYASCLVCPSPSTTLGRGDLRAVIQGPQAAWGLVGLGVTEEALVIVPAEERPFFKKLL